LTFLKGYYKNYVMNKKLNLGGHSLLGQIAFSTLPRWEKNLIKPDMTRDGLDKPYFPKGISTVEEKVGLMCSILDWVYYEEMRSYTLLPDGRWIPHSPPDAHGQSCVGSCQMRSNTVFLEMIEWLLGRMLEAVEKRDWEENFT